MSVLHNFGIVQFLIWAIVLLFFASFGAAFPMGLNLPPLGGSLGGSWAGVNWDTYSTYAFTDIYKHCSTPYIRSTGNGGRTYGYQSNTQVSWRSDGYPTSLPYTSTSSFWMMMCDIGLGGPHVRNGTYYFTWSGTGDVGFSPETAKILTYDSASRSGTVKIAVPFASKLGVTVRILKSVSTDPVHNVHVVPIEFKDTYMTDQIFHPEFLSIVSKFDMIRFTGWFKLTSASNGKKWESRTLPESQTQHGQDGVAIEHVVDLVRESGVKSIWLSFPLLSLNYNTEMITLLESTLPTNVTIYYEAGSPEDNGDSNRYSEFLSLNSLFNQIFENSTKGCLLMPSASINNIAYLPYTTEMWFKHDGMQLLKAVAVPGQFGRSTKVWDHFDSYAQWDNTYANYTMDAILDEIRTSILVGEVNLNYMRQRFLGSNPQLEFISFDSGLYITAKTYGFRAGRDSVLNCAKNARFPCSWANTNYYFTNQSQIDAVMNVMNDNCTKEQKVENLLIDALKRPEIYDMYLDFLRRWEAIGGGTLMTPRLIQPVVYCPKGGKGCGNSGMFEESIFETRRNVSNLVKFRPFLDYHRGIRSSLPYTSSDLPLPSVHSCQPSCVWGTCYQSKCKCFAGYSGVSCDVRVPKGNDCNSDVGMNPASIADWSSEWVFVDLFRTSRAWISQDFADTKWNTQTPQNLSIHDYPNALLVNQKLGAMMIRDLKTHIRNGTYICLYDGDGIINFSMDIVSVKRSVGRIEVTVSPTTGLNNGVFLIIERTNPDNPIRNIRFIMPGFEHIYESFPFHPLYLNSLKNYKVLRFMDLQLTNSIKISHWSERSTTAFRSYSSATVMPAGNDGSGPGVPLEVLILLSNTLGTSPWFNMPHLCTDEFVYHFATMVKERLRPDVEIFIEYSNEVWGTLFAGGVYAQEMGLR